MEGQKKSLHELLYTLVYSLHCRDAVPTALARGSIRTTAVQCGTQAKSGHAVTASPSGNRVPDAVTASPLRGYRKR